jgi:UDP-N-acetylglucosamine 2-epimerase (non-hydrolysing)
MITVVSSASARPNFVKLAAVHHALMKHPDRFKHVIVHTGQHYDPLLSDVFFTQLEIADPEFNLGVKGGADRETTIQMTANAMEPVLKKVKPDIVLVYGDVNGAVGAARAAKKLGIKIGHVEAGLRSFDTSMPEELNRIEIDMIADELFVTEQSAIDHLKKEKAKGKIHFVGNTMIDTLMRMRPRIDSISLPQSLPKKVAVVTIHRPSNVDDPSKLSELLRFLVEISTQCPVVFPIHKRTYAIMEQHDLFSFFRGNDAIWTIDPLGYEEFLHLVSSYSNFIVTDSGGIQEEAAFLGKRCFTLRRNTERPSTIESGSNVLIDPDNATDRERVLEFAKHPQDITVKIPEKWDGEAGDRIADVLAKSH